jgi:hypothetical protein
MSRFLYLRIDIEKCFHAVAQLRLNFFLGAIEHMHGDASGASIFQFHGSVPHRFDFVRRKQPHAIYQRQVRHEN